MGIAADGLLVKPKVKERIGYVSRDQQSAARRAEVNKVKKLGRQLQ